MRIIFKLFFAIPAVICFCIAYKSKTLDGQTYSLGVGILLLMFSIII